jgi:hypothetical protein
MLDEIAHIGLDNMHTACGKHMPNSNPSKVINNDRSLGTFKENLVLHGLCAPRNNKNYISSVDENQVLSL